VKRFGSIGNLGRRLDPVSALPFRRHRKIVKSCASTQMMTKHALNKHPHGIDRTASKIAWPCSGWVGIKANLFSPPLLAILHGAANLAPT
jgi:hypothetical protein